MFDQLREKFCHKFSLKKENCIDVVPILIFSILLLFLYRNLEVSKMWAFGDLVAFPTNIAITKDWCLYVWNQGGMGYAPLKPFSYYLSMLALSFIFGGFFTQKIIFLSIPLISFSTFCFLLRRFKVRIIPSFLGALTYAFNPITISDFVGGSMTLVVYSIFPLIFIFIIKIMQRKKIELETAFILGLLGFFLFNIPAAFWYVIVVVPVILLEMPSPKKSLKKIARLAMPLIVMTLILLPSILVYLGMYRTGAGGDATFEGEARYCYEDSAFYNIVRLAGNKGSAQAEPFLNYSALNSYTVLGYALPIVAFFPFIVHVRTHIVMRRQEEKNKKTLSTTAAITFLTSSGLILLVKTLPFIVDLNPIFASLRNPAKLMYPLSFSLCLLFTIGTEKLIKPHEKNSVKISVIIGFILTIIILTYNYPVLDGTMGLSKTRADAYYIDNKYYSLPDVLKGIDENYTDHRVLFLPWERPTLLAVRSEIPNYFGVSIGKETFPDISWAKKIFEAIAVRNSIDRSHLLSLFDVKYIVIDKNFKTYNEGQKWYEDLKKDRSYVVYSSGDSWYATGEPDYYYQVFNIDSDFDLVYEDQEFAILRNQRIVPKLYARSNFVNLILAHTSISQNLLTNPSFENNTEHWKIWPDELTNITRDSLDKNNAIVLYGQEKLWTSCYQIIHVDENALYGWKFFVKGSNITDMHAKIYWYDISENLTERNTFFVNYIKLYQMGLDDDRWYAIEEVFPAPKGAKMARIQFSGNRFHNFTNTAMYIDNVSFYEAGIIIKNKNEVFSSITPINYTKINPTKYILKTDATTSFMVAFTEIYNPSWVAYVNGAKVSSTPLYDIINGFWINQTGQLEITIEYEPQKWFYYGSIVSVATILACLTYLTYNWTKNKAFWKRIETILRAR